MISTKYNAIDSKTVGLVLFDVQNVYKYMYACVCVFSEDTYNAKNNAYLLNIDKG